MSKVAAADILVVSGGNTLFARDRWEITGAAGAMKAAAERGCVLAGGSAGAICWFDGGHSDSWDPDTYRDAMLEDAAVEGAVLEGAVLEEAGGEGDAGKDEASTFDGESGARPWKYLRVPCLSIFPGLVCPHADSVQSNGLLRMADFDEMMVRHSGERGIAIDHWAALKFDGEGYEVHGLEGKGGSVGEDGGWVGDRTGAPGCWIKEVVGGAVTTTLAAKKGKVEDLLRTATAIVEDPGVAVCRRENKCDEDA